MTKKRKLKVRKRERADGSLLLPVLGTVGGIAFGSAGYVVQAVILGGVAIAGYFFGVVPEEPAKTG